MTLTEKKPPSLSLCIKIVLARMINAVAGPRGRNFSQGPVGGYLRELGYSENEVVKL